MRPFRFLAVLPLLALLAAPAAVDAQSSRPKAKASSKASGKASSGKMTGKLYRWTDAQGNVHYTDTLPDEALTQGRDEYSRRGRLVDQVARPPTPEEKAEADARKAQAQADADAKEARQRELAALRTTYPSEQAIARDFEQRKAVYEGQITASEALLKERHRTLVDQLRNAGNAELQGKEPSPQMVTAIRNLAAQVQQHRQSIAHSQLQLQSLAADQAKMREEWEAARAASPAP